MSGRDDVVRAGDWVRTGTALLGTKRGPSRSTGRRPGEIPEGAVGEIFEVEPLTGLLTLHFDLEGSGPREPFRVEAHASASEVQRARRPPLPPVLPLGD